MINVPTRAILVAGCVLFVACGVLAGAAAANAHGGGDDEWTVGVDGEVDVAGNGGDGGFTCTGMPTDHDCDKGGDVSAGPGTVDYDGYNRGSFDEGYYEFEDRFVITDGDGNGIVVVVPCEFEDDAPEDNPCPPTVEEYDGDGQGDADDDGQGSGDGSANDGDGGSDASDDRRDNGDDGGNANDEDKADDRRDGDEEDEGPVDADADVTVEPPSDGPLP